ncbi:MAG: class I SAM-dependent methyltransferase [Gemmatimonadetes bacterium]|nr:class I SAM-dependent methyltransferase [Gemmatimonadota bacterium]
MMRGRIHADMTVLDAGCGGGRNLHYLIKNGAGVHGVDTDRDAVRRAGELAARLAPGFPEDRFRVAPVEELPHDDASFDAVLSNAVLHFARNEDHFASMLREMWRVLRPGGVLFARVASSVGLEGRLTASEGARRYWLPDGSERFLVDEAYLMHWTAELDGKLLDPVKTTVVQDLRSMTTWVLRKEA